MSKFPVESQDQEGIRDAVNYLLSGPGGLGQNFSGFSSSENAYITGNFRKPYTQSTVATLYVPSITLSQAEMLDERTFKYTFLATQPSPPFSLGNGLSISGFTDDIYNTYPSSNANRNRSLGQIGVIECTTDYVIIRSTVITTIHAPETASGSVFFYCTNKNAGADPLADAQFIDTDCDTRVNVTGGTDRVFVSGQVNLLLDYTATTSTDFYVVVEIDRYFGFVNDDPTNPDYLFNYDATIGYKIYTFSVSAGTGTLPAIETIFTTILDQPPIGYYRYFLTIGLGTNQPLITDAQITQGVVGLRGLSTQVVKQ